MGSWVRVAKSADFLPGRAHRVEVGDHDIAVWRAGDRFLATGNICAHHHVPVLHQGSLHGLTITCPMHGWAYDLQTGRAVEGSGRVPTYSIRLRAGWVEVEIPDAG